MTTIASDVKNESAAPKTGNSIAEVKGTSTTAPKIDTDKNASSILDQIDPELKQHLEGLGNEAKPTSASSIKTARTYSYKEEEFTAAIKFLEYADKDSRDEFLDGIGMTTEKFFEVLKTLQKKNADNDDIAFGLAVDAASKRDKNSLVISVLLGRRKDLIKRLLKERVTHKVIEETVQKMEDARFQNIKASDPSVVRIEISPAAFRTVFKTISDELKSEMSDNGKGRRGKSSRE